MIQELDGWNDRRSCVHSCLACGMAGRAHVACSAFGLHATLQHTSASSRIACCSCEGANKGGVLTGEMRRNPHVQSYVVATDQVGPAVWPLIQSGGHQSPDI